MNHYEKDRVSRFFERCVLFCGYLSKKNTRLVFLETGIFLLLNRYLK
jgi:hypothetical protein